ncbi:MAG: Crp/Fnr family transcriptional regulator [Candidatus Zixiibacteriota bacterium]
MKKALAESVLFSGLSESELQQVESTGNKVEVDKGRIIFFQGDPGEHFYLVLSGRVKIFKNSPDGKEQILLMAGEGETFGEAALFAEIGYPANAEAVEKTTLISFSREKFLALIHQQPDIAVNLIARLSMLLHHLTRLVQHLSLEDISTRLAGYLLDLAPEDCGKSCSIVLKEKKMVLASILGTIPETLSRAFARLTKDGVIAVDGQTIQVKDIDRLTDIAAGQKI